MEEKWMYSLWGAAAGVAALAVVGFTWGGWTTGSNAEAMALKRSRRRGRRADSDLHPEVPGQCKCSGEARGTEEHRRLVASPRLRREWRMGDLRPRAVLRAGRCLCRGSQQAVRAAPKRSVPRALVPVRSILTERVAEGPLKPTNEATDARRRRDGLPVSVWG